MFVFIHISHCTASKPQNLIANPTNFIANPIIDGDVEFELENIKT